VASIAAVRVEEARITRQGAISRASIMNIAPENSSTIAVPASAPTWALKPCTALRFRWASQPAALSRRLADSITAASTTVPVLTVIAFRHEQGLRKNNRARSLPRKTRRRSRPTWARGRRAFQPAAPGHHGASSLRGDGGGGIRHVMRNGDFPTIGPACKFASMTTLWSFVVLSYQLLLPC
jgi:hypothetical protein